MSTLSKGLGRGLVAIASLVGAVVLLLAGPASIAQAIAVSNNLQTEISLDTNPATGSNTFTTLPPITLTCGVVDVTAGVADGVAGITLRLSAGWTFQGGAAPSISYAAWPAPDGQATGTIASANTITNNIGTSCSPGSVVTFTGVQVQPLSGTTGSGTITADISTADVIAASLTVQVVAPTATPTPAPTGTATPAPTATPATTATPVAAPTGTPVTAPTVTPPVGSPAPGSGPSAGPDVPSPAATGSGGFADGAGSMSGGIVAIAAIGLGIAAIAVRSGVRARKQ